MGLGSVRLVSLAEAREKATQHRSEARAGNDPFLLRQRSSRSVPTFEVAALQVHADFLPSWKNEKHGNQWISTLKQYAFPVFGSVRVDQIQSSHVLQALSPIWLTRPETARRVKQRIGAVLDWAKAAGHRSGENPIDGVTRGLPKQTDGDVHHAALPYDQLAAFLLDLRGVSTSAVIKLAFEFMILTAARTSEVLLAEPAEFDLEQKVWIVPAARMKAGKEHRVPLSDRCLEILDEVAQYSVGKYAFPSENPDRPLSNMAFLMVLRRMGKKITAHGFRSTFRDWAAERTNYPREVCEAALAHAVENKVEAAYRRTDLFEKRRSLIDAWARFATQRGEVVSLRKRARV
jgi:integrase